MTSEIFRHHQKEKSFFGPSCNLWSIVGVEHAIIVWRRQLWETRRVNSRAQRTLSITAMANARPRYKNKKCGRTNREPRKGPVYPRSHSIPWFNRRRRLPAWPDSHTSLWKVHTASPVLKRGRRLWCLKVSSVKRDRFRLGDTCNCHMAQLCRNPHRREGGHKPHL